MRLFLLAVLVMLAFAGNSLLTRAGVTLGQLGAVEFAVIRLGSGAAMLALLVILRRGRGLVLTGRARLEGVAALLIYLFGFSYANLGLDAGLGALILFGMVQITMFAGGLIAAEVMPARRWIGAALAMLGLAWLLWPVGQVTVSLWHGLLMALGGIGWGLYSLSGRREADALSGTAANFIVSALLVGLGWGALALLDAPGARDLTVGASTLGITLAVASGAVTSGMGYALWYTVLPRLEASVAAVMQLTVPVIAMLGGMLWLGEVLTLRFALAALLVLGGVAISVRPARAQRGNRISSGS